MAIHELSKALPEAQRPLPLERVEVNDNATFYLPNAGITGGSTAAEGSCEAVRRACKQLVLHCPHNPYLLDLKIRKRMGITGGSTAAKGSCEAVRMACKQLVRLARHFTPYHFIP